MHTPFNNLHSHLTDRQISKLRWRPWFAWKPVRLQSGKLAWFEIVYRRKVKIKICRYPDYSPGDFTMSVSLEGYTYITNIEYLIETIKGKESYYQDAQRILREKKEGTFEINGSNS